MTLVQFEFRSDTRAGWTATNPVIGKAEPVFEEDTGLWRIGNGTSRYLDLGVQSANPVLLQQISDVAVQAAADAVVARNEAVAAAGGGSPATATTAGVVALATDAEAVASTDTTKAVTPANLGAKVAALPNATTAARGLAQLASNTEAAAGTDATKAVTPSGIAAYVTATGLSVPDATTTAKGKVRLATNTEAVAGTDTLTAMTPAAVVAKINALPTGTTGAAGPLRLATSAEANTGTDTAKAVTAAGVVAAINSRVPANADAIADGTTKVMMLATERATLISIAPDVNPTANTVMKRSAGGQAQAADPVDDADLATRGWVNNALEGVGFSYSETMDSAAPGSLFYRMCVAGVWPVRGSARTDIAVAWISRAVSDPAPPDGGAYSIGDDYWQKLDA